MRRHPTHRDGAPSCTISKAQAPADQASCLCATVDVAGQGGQAGDGPEDNRSQHTTPPVLETKKGYNCVVVIVIQGIKFRILLDSGASRNVIRKSFANHLWTTKKTSKAAYGP